MSHLPHDHVHRLIRSMSPAEKRYFKLYTGRHLVGGQSNYRDLFDAIAGMEVYDERELHARFEGAAFLRRFTVIKHRLYDTILASLEAFHAGSSVEARLRRQLHQVELLHQRGLYHDAERMLRNLALNARQHGKLSVLLEVVEWERRLMERTNYQHVDEADLLNLSRTVKELRAEHDETEDLWQLKSRSFMLLYRQGKARSARVVADLRSLLDHPLLREGATLRSPKAEYLHHHIRSAVAYAMNDPVACEQALSKNADLLQQKEAHFRDEPNLLLSVLSNLAYVHMRLGRHDAAFEGLKRFKQIPAMMPTAPTRDLEMKVFAMGASLEQALLCRMGDFDRAVERSKAVEEGCARFADSLSLIRKAGLRFQVAWACFGAGRLDLAARWCQTLLNERGIETLEEAHTMARLLQLLILLESDKLDLLRYAQRNLDRFLKSHARQHGVEQALLRYVKARMQGASPTSAQVAHASLVRDLEELAADPLEHAVFDHFDPLCYALSKSSGRSMSAVARERLLLPAVKPAGPSKRRAA